MGPGLPRLLNGMPGIPDALNELEADFLAASQAQSEQEAVEREIARQAGN